MDRFFKAILSPRLFGWFGICPENPLSQVILKKDDPDSLFLFVSCLNLEQVVSLLYFNPMTGRTAVLTFLSISLVFCISARADEDGSFCTARDYLAYEVRNGSTPGVSGHVLKVVRFGAKKGIYAAGEIALQDFQVHRMICEKDRIEISGWAATFTKYKIDISQENPELADHAEDSKRQFDPAKEGPEAPKFAHSPLGLIALESLDPNHKYALLISGSEKTVRGGIKHRRKAELIQTDLQGTVSQRLVLYQSELSETID